MVWERLREDIRVFNLKHKGQGRFLSYLYYPGFRTIIFIRLAQWFLAHRLKVLAYLLTTMNDVFAGIWLGPQVQIGKGFYLGHARGLVVNPNTKIGDYCTVVQQVGLGGPDVTIGDYVSIGAGAKIVSTPDRPIVVGDFVKIGAGSVVTKNVPNFSVVAGVPGRVLRKITLSEIYQEWGLILSPELEVEVKNRLYQESSLHGKQV